MPSDIFNNPLIVGNTTEIGSDASLTSNGTHTLSTDNTTCYGVVISDQFRPEAESCTGASLYVFSDIVEGTFDSFACIEVVGSIGSWPTTFYGIKIDSPSHEGTGVTNQYGLFIDSQTVATNNYAIYTNDGAVRLGDLAGTGNRTVMVHSDGTLYAA